MYTENFHSIVNGSKLENFHLYKYDLYIKMCNNTRSSGATFPRIYTY